MPKKKHDSTKPKVKSDLKVRIGIVQTLKPYLYGPRKLLLSLGGLKIYAVLLALCTPQLYRMLIDRVLIKGEMETIWWLIGAYIAIYALESLGIVLEKRTNNRVFSMLKLRLQKKMLREVTNMPHEAYEAYVFSDLKARLEDDVAAVERFFKEHVLEFSVSILSIVVLAAMMLTISPFLACMGFVAVPLAFLVAKFMGKHAGIVAKEFRHQHAQYEAYVYNAFEHWREIKSQGLEKDHSQGLSGYWSILTDLFVKRQVFWYLNRAFIAFKDFFITRINLYFIGGLLIMNNQLSVDVLLMFMLYYALFYGHIEKLANWVATLSTEVAAIQRVTDLLEQTHLREMQTLRRSEPIVSQPLDLEVKSLTFTYSADMPPVLDQLSATFAANTHTAITGPSGCGKTTLAKLLLGQYTQQQGEITIGTVPIDQISSRTRAKLMGAVMQEPYLLNLSIADNLRLAKPKATMAELQRACEHAAIASFIERLPQGFDTLIGERGVKLSGGQKQRLAIARTILLDPAIIVFDEATSSLDNENEQHILQTMAAISASKTLISIAHRQSTVAAADYEFSLS